MQQEFPQLSKQHHQPLDFPATALLNLEKKVVLIFQDLYLKSLFFLMKIIFLKNSLTVLGNEALDTINTLQNGKIKKLLRMKVVYNVLIISFQELIN
jgi:hypothetical protein